MAKAKKKKKIILKHIIKSTKKFHHRKAFFLSALILILIFVYLSSLLLVKGQSKIKYCKIVNSISLKRNVVQKLSVITPYPSITVTPTPAPLTGYCLRVPVLMYHHIQPEATAKQLGQTSLTVDSGMFSQQMAYLATSGYTPIWANELVNALLTHAGLPSKPIVITMDDGYADNDIYALPVLRQYGFKANLMLASGLVGANSDMLTWGQVNDLKNNGFYITNHTWSHWSINQGTQDKIESEIDIAQSQIQQYTGQTVNIFTYPYGSFNNNAIETLQRKGYLGAFTEIPGQYQCDSFIMTLHRTRIGNAPLSYYGI
jgi:peptidoglycan/xylan/chitin deacetylase (PgdA/CDA1 family)